MGEVNRALGASGAGHILRDGDDKIPVLPPTQKCYAKYEAWLEDVARQKLEARRASMSVDEYEVARAELAERIDSLVYSWGSRACKNAMRSIAGQAQLAAILIQQTRPSFTAADALRIMKSDPEHYVDVMKAVIPEGADPNVEKVLA